MMPRNEKLPAEEADASIGMNQALSDLRHQMCHSDSEVSESDSDSEDSEPDCLGKQYALGSVIKLSTATA
jgi:hypothetical protein